MVIDPNNPNVPILNQPARIMLWYPTVMVQCKCVTDRMSIVIITGISNAAQCGHCGKLYTIKQMNPQSSPEVEILIPPPAAGVVQ